MLAVEVRRHTAAQPWTYAMLDQRQREVAAQVRAGGPGAILLSEVAPVITLGRRAAVEELLLSRARLAELGVEVLPTDRGGLATYHGPGQWVLFVVDSLERLTGDRRGVRAAVEGLLAITRDVGARYDSSAEIREGCETGAWTRAGKFGAVGIHVENGVLQHGLAVNGYATPTSFVGLRPCGLDAPVSFLLAGTADSAREAAFQALGSHLSEAAQLKFSHT
jgi:lipoate-protein ligase B